MPENHIGRFAPSPSGRMHLGNIYAALMSYASVKKRGGQWLLRIEDLDRSRSHREFADQIIDDLLWLGLVPDLGASTTADDRQFYQSNRDDIYEKYFDILKAQDIVYECFCRRNELNVASAPHASDGHAIYGGTCRMLSEQRRAELQQERTPCWRLRLPDEVDCFEDELFGTQRANLLRDRGDFIIRRADGNFAYNLAVVVDDALMGVSEVVRGCDLLTVSHEQRFLCRCLGFEAPHYCHIPLLLSPDGRRLSKRDKSLAMDVLRRNHTPEQIIGIIAHIIGIQATPNALSLSEFVQSFDIHKIEKTEGIVVDG